MSDASISLKGEAREVALAEAQTVQSMARDEMTMPSIRAWGSRSSR